MGFSRSCTRCGRSALLVALLSFAAGSQFSPAWAQPAQTVRLIVPLAPGGGNDVAARLIAQGMSKTLGQQIVVDNRPGGGTVIASGIVANAPADGHTLYLVSVGFTLAQILQPKLPFDSVRDFSPISRVAISPGALIVHPSLPVKQV